MSRCALGMLETYGMIAAVEGMDSALKAANVTFKSFTYVSGGLITFFVEGDVGAVKAAISAAEAAAARVGKVVSCHVIARPAEMLAPILTPPEKPGKRKGGVGIHRRDFAKPIPEAEPTTVPETPVPIIEPSPPEAVVSEEEPVLSETAIDRVYTREELDAMRTVALRTLLRGTPGSALTGVEIRDAKKETLIAELLRLQGEDGG